jgi:hypothetical protein
VDRRASRMIRMPTNSSTAGYAPSGDVRHPDEYRSKSAAPIMQAVDAMPTEWRALVNEFGYIDVYRAWRRGWSIAMVRQATARNGFFELRA